MSFKNNFCCCDKILWHEELSATQDTSIFCTILKAQVPSPRSGGKIVRARDREGQKKTVFCTHELSAAVVACTWPIQDEVSQDFSAKGKGLMTPPPKETQRNCGELVASRGWESQFSSRAWLLVGQSCSGGCPTPRNIWTAQTEFGELLFKKKWHWVRGWEVGGKGVLKRVGGGVEGKCDQNT